MTGHDILRWGVLLIASSPLLYYAFAWDSARRFFARPAAPGEPAFAPPISVLKPVRGVDRHAFEHFASFCHQDYPEFEVLFAVTDEFDPAVPVIGRLIRAFPERNIRLITGVPEIGASSKVSKLCRLVREARHDLLVISDSDIAVPRDYLRAVAAPFRDPAVGAVTCLYRGAPDPGLPADLEAIGISTDFVPSVIVGRRVEGVKFMLGATMATTRAHVAEIGGFEALADYCADDFELGRRIAACGHRIELAACTVSTECALGRMADFFKHELRWAITIRHSRRSAYIGRVLFTQGLPWLVVVAWLGPSFTAAAIYGLLYITLRLAVAWEVAVRGLRDETVTRRWWLVPIHDAIAFVTSVVACCSNRIEWKGRRFDLHQGRLVPAPFTNRPGRELLPR
jgi:ceramide glucosyltransferase